MGLYAADGRARLYLHPRREMVEDRGNHPGFPESLKRTLPGHNGHYVTRCDTRKDITMTVLELLILLLIILIAASILGYRGRR